MIWDSDGQLQEQVEEIKERLRQRVSKGPDGELRQRPKRKIPNHTSDPNNPSPEIHFIENKRPINWKISYQTLNYKISYLIKKITNNLISETSKARKVEGYHESSLATAAITKTGTMAYQIFEKIYIRIYIYIYLYYICIYSKLQSWIAKIRQT